MAKKKPAGTITVVTPSAESSADQCRRNGWNVGTVLEGDEGYGITRILVTAIGESAILARHLSHKGIRSSDDRECSWTLSCRKWIKSIDQVRGKAT